MNSLFDVDEIRQALDHTLRKLAPAMPPELRQIIVDTTLANLEMSRRQLLRAMN